MVATQAKVNNDTIRYWLPDPADLVRLMQLLEICGYTDEHMAREDASENEESDAIFEVTVRRREVSAPHMWREEVNWIEDLHDTVWHA